MDNQVTNVLVIDDNHSFVDSVKVILKEVNMNLKIDSADRFNAARRMLEEESYALILLDNETETSQKGTDFVESIIKADESYSKENFIIFSARFDQIQGQFKAKEIKAFPKPFKIPEFQAFTQKLLAGLAEKKVS